MTQPRIRCHALRAARLACACLAVVLLPPAFPQVPGGQTPAARLEAATLRIDWLVRSYHAPFYLAVERGWYRDAGIDLAIREGRGSANVVTLVANRSDTFGLAGADAVVRGLHTGVPVVSVANLMPRNSDAIFALRSSGIRRPQDLRGRSIGSTPGGTSDALLPAFLRGAGLSTADVTVIPLDASAKVAMLLQGKVDAINAVAWSTSLNVAPGGTHRFLYADFGVHAIGYCIVVHPAAIDERPELVGRFVAVTLRAWAHAKENPDEALAALYRAVPEIARPDLAAGQRAEFLEALALVGPAVPGRPLGTHDEAGWTAMVRQLLEYKAIKDAAPGLRYYIDRFVR